MATSDSGEILIETEGVERTFHGPRRLALKGGVRLERSAKRVLNNISLRVREGEWVSLVGPSGSGKTTLFNLILGRDFPTAGIVRVGGKPVTNVNRDCGIVFQAYSLFPFLTVLDNIAAGRIYHETALMEGILGLRHLPWTAKKYSDAREEARNHLAAIGLSAADAMKFPDELSGGMRQRVAIAQALIAKPRVLLMDEPFGALDYTTRQEVRAFAMSEKEKHNLTVLLVTHELDEAVLTGTRLLGLTQYYTEHNGEKGVGARIAVDLDLRARLPGPYPRAREVTVTPEFQQIVRLLEDKVLDPQALQRVHEFDLNHRDAVASTRSGASVRGG